MQTNRRLFIGGGIALAASSATSVLGQSGYPNRPIRLIVPYPPGGGTDFFARLVGAAMSQSLGQPIIVENRPGAATVIGAEAVARSTPDGYTFLLGDVATYAANPSLYQKLSYDPQKDFSPISLTGRFAIVLLVNTNKLKVDWWLNSLPQQERRRAQSTTRVEALVIRFTWLQKCSPRRRKSSSIMFPTEVPRRHCRTSPGDKLA